MFVKAAQRTYILSIGGPFAFMREHPTEVVIAGKVGDPAFVIPGGNGTVDGRNKRTGKGKHAGESHPQLVSNIYTVCFPVPHTKAIVADYKVDIIFTNYTRQA